jgi:hypothetical protein
VFAAIAPDRQVEPVRQRVHHRDAHAVQAAGDLVGVLVEFPARVQLGHDDLGRRHAFFGVDLGGNAAAVIGHAGGAVGVQVTVTCEQCPASASSMALSTTS